MGVNGIYGLSGSGLDIESLVKMGMSGKNKQYDKMEQQEIANTWLKEAYNNVYNDLTTYKYGTLSTYKMQSNMNAMAATSSNSGVVTATANGAAAAMNHTVEVTSVASNAYLQTAQKDSSGAAITGIKRENTNANTSDMLADVMYKSYSVASATEDGNNWNFTYNITRSDGSTATVNGSDVAVSLKIKDSDAKDAKEYTISYTYDELFTGYASGTYTGYTGDEKTLFEGGKTLYDLASAVAKTGANIQGGYDIANDSFSLYNKTSGKSNIIDLTVQNDDTATLFTNLRLGVVSDNTLSNAIKFETPTAMPTTMESVDLNTSITSSAQSVSLKDVLGLTSTVNGDGSTTVKGVNSAGEEITVGTFSNGTDTVFSMNLSNGTASAAVRFTLDDLFSNNLGLDELASRINQASTANGLGITAAYDAIKDSFSLSNPTGQANLTAASGTGEAVADRLEKSLNLTTSPELTYLTVDNSSNLADIFGLKTVVYRGSDDTYHLEVQNKSDSSVVGSVASEDQSAIKNCSGALFTFDISDGTKSATVTINLEDIVDSSAFRVTEGNLAVQAKGYSTEQKVGINKRFEVRDPSSFANNLSKVAAKINAAVTSAGLNIEAKYENGTFSLLNSSGHVTITNSDGAKVDVSSFATSLTPGDPSTMAYKTSASITRVNATSSDSSLAAAVGFTAVKNTDGTLTIKKSDGSFENVADATSAALTFKVGNGTTETEVSLSYAELFDTTGTGILKGTADFSTLVAKINSSSAGVTAAYDASTGKFSLTNAAGNATLTGVDSLTSTLVSKMGLEESEETKAAKEAAGQLHKWAGTNAEVKIDGKTYDNDTNKLTVAGVTYTFLDKTDGAKATISVSQDTDKIVDYVKSFVEEYNKLLDSLNEKLSEQKYSDYKPLSKRQEDEMTEKQIEKWNEKAKSGLLYHNSTIRDLVSAMRETIYTKVDAVDSEYNTLSAIGITTTNTKGHLTLDTDKLRKALADDPDCVYQLFASDQDSSYIAGTTNKNKITTAQQRMDYANTGVANRLYNVMTNYMDKISDIAGTSKETDDQSYLGKLITGMKTKMSTFKTQMTAYENKLFKRYDAMEVALSRLSMQLSYISGSFS